MLDKIIVVTGANAGIGYATARQLARRGATVALWCRTSEKTLATRDQLLAEVPEARLETYAADLSSQAAIRAACAEIRQRHPRIDGLINNAGIWNSKRELTEDGIERVTAVNHLAPFLTSHLLYPALTASGAGRIINVASDSHFQVKALPDDIQLPNNYHGLRSYAVSKLANVLFTYEFERRKPTDSPVSIYAVQPGLVQTDIGLKHTNWLHALAWRVRRKMKGNKTPDEGAATSVYLATDPQVADQSGLYWDNSQPKQSSAGSYDTTAAARLWEDSLAWCGIETYFL